MCIAAISRAKQGGYDMNAVMHQLLSSESGKTKPVRVSKARSRTRAKRNRLLNRDSLDGRLAVAKEYDNLVAEIIADLGGKDRLSTIEIGLIEAHAGAKIVFSSTNMKILMKVLLGEELEPALVNMQALSISAMVRTASKLGTARRATLVPSLDEWLAQKAREEGEILESEIVK
jgi:hypothetical protein